MNDIRPFRGITPNESVVGPLANVLCPPYDVISPAEQAALYERSPYNMVRLELGVEKPGDGSFDNRYTRAATTLEEWMAQGALLQEKSPSLYIYDQEFSVDGKRTTRRGLLAALRLARWDEGVVLPHEETLTGPKEDRLRLMRAVDCDLSPIFLLFEDETGSARREMERLSRAKPSAAAETVDGQVHRLWTVSGEALNALLPPLRQAQLFVADGHHRYETALAYRDERRANDPNPSEDAAYNFLMVLLVDAGDPGLVVLPTHRLIRGVGDERLAGMDAALQDRFRVESVDIAGVDAGEAARRLLDRMKELGGSGSAIGFYRRGGQAKVLVSDLPASGRAAGRAPLLDVDVLHEQLLEPLLGIGPEQLRAGTQVAYTRDAADAIEAVERGESQAAFLLNPTKVSQVLETARAGGKMPQKATYFYPKPTTGLVIDWLRGELE